MRFHARNVGRSSAVASSYTRHNQNNQANAGERGKRIKKLHEVYAMIHETLTHAKGMPHVRERLRNDMQHTHTTMQKWEMIISHICQVNITSPARVEKATAKRSSIEDAYVAEARLGADEFVEEPGRVWEVGAHEWAWRAEEVEED
jgi:hypothetical protein